MIKEQEYRQFKAYVRQDGFFVGLLMVLTFVCMIRSLQHPELELIGLMSVVATPLLIVYFVKRYRDKVLSGSISFRRILAYSMSCFAYGALVLALGAFVYMRYLDAGMFVMGLRETLEKPEMAELLKVYGLSNDQLMAEVNAIAALRPIDIALSLITNVFMSGFVASLIIALFVRKKPAVKQ